jgi:hypothetical protein
LAAGWPVNLAVGWPVNLAAGWPVKLAAGWPVKLAAGWPVKLAVGWFFFFLGTSEFQWTWRPKTKIFTYNKKIRKSSYLTLFIDWQ